MSFKRNKRGVVGTLIATFVATIVIVLILVIFTLGAGVVKFFGQVQDGLLLRGVNEVGIGDAGSYLVSFVKVVRLRSLFEAEGEKFEDAFDKSEKISVKKISGTKSLRFKYVGAERDDK